MINFDNLLKDKIEDINNILSSYLPKEEGLSKTILQAMNYSVLAGGKRLRPMMMLETYRMFGGNSKVIEPFMAAIEFIHTYSLVHDDLPAMDNDEYRRGKKTTHAVFGEAMGVLAGDALLNYAFEVALGAFDIEENKNVIKALGVLSKKAGIYGMIGGQVVDIESEGKAVGIETIEFIHKMKCAALIESSMVIGSILAGATQEEQDKIELIASDIGYAFQIQDDILDVTSTTQIIGKPAGSDDKNSKVTYVSLKGLDKAKQDVEFLSNRALSQITTLAYKNEFLEELIVRLIKRNK